MTLDKIPFRTFDGFVKQHAHDLLSPREQALFDFLFPAFQGTSDSQDAYEQARSDPLWIRCRGSLPMMRRTAIARRSLSARTE